jgi:serine/threonine protein kinase
MIKRNAMSYAGLSAHVDLDSRPDPTGKFKLKQVIGEGTYGEVYSAVDLATGEPDLDVIDYIDMKTIFCFQQAVGE